MEEFPSELEKCSLRRPSGEESSRISRECLRTAFIQLLSEQEFSKISITELVQRAGVSRATFYRHYGTKEALMEELADTAAAELKDFLRTDMTPKDVQRWSLRIFRKLKENERIARNMMSFQLSLHTVLSMMPLTGRDAPPKDPMTRYRHLAFEGAFLSIVRGWLADGLRQSPEEMADICSLLIAEGQDRSAQAQPCSSVFSVGAASAAASLDGAVR